jgi:hypothetical protein
VLFADNGEEGIGEMGGKICMTGVNDVKWWVVNLTVVSGLDS